MRTIDSIVGLRAQVAEWRRQGEVIGFVPTMGNLHEGHLSLVVEAKGKVDRVVVSIFVNPTQFGEGEDFDSYPRTVERDAQLLADVGVDVLFMPSVEAVYPKGLRQVTQVLVPDVSEGLCGEFRPGHFAGVATVVAKLFNMVRPDVAVFGQKDFQQLAVIRRMVADLCFPVEIVAAPTMREADGLAMSSRNSYLSVQERTIAPMLYQVVQQAVERVRAGEVGFLAIERESVRVLSGCGFDPEYFFIREQVSLRPVSVREGGLVVLVAAYLGRTRLIDNMVI